ncbi:MAG TPA: carbonate dehydratase [Pyrinomonadaceae bacterium]|jgi:carbonic anhydrase|nr:carbonate dehydratase [Pyrinomonadaceae bacterium]
MPDLKDILDKNRAWAEGIRERDPGFFSGLSQQQTPSYLWIGCSDSRVPATQLINAMPGEVFEHRNVSNVVVHTDFNCLSVMQYAVDVLKIKHIIVCGHYGCGGVKAAMQNLRLGLIDNWLRHVQDVMEKHGALLNEAADEARRLDRLCELNVVEQVRNASQTTIVQSAWERGQELAIHGWIYGLDDGLLRELNLCVTNQDDLSSGYLNAIKAFV